MARPLLRAPSGTMGGLSVRRGRGSLFALAFSAFSGRAQAAEVGAPMALDWSAPPECPTREQVIDRVTVILGRSTKPRAAIGVRAVAARTPSGRWRVDLAVDHEGGSGARGFEAESCDAAADATALIVGLMVDPTAVSGADASSGAPDAASGAPDADAVPPGSEEAAPPPATRADPPPPLDAARPSAPLEPPPRPRSSESPRSTPAGAPWFAVRASLAGDLGTFSSANVGGELLVAVSPGRLRFELAGSQWASSTATLAGAPSEGARLDLTTLGVRAAYVLAAREVALAPFVGVEADRMSATGFGGTAQHHQTANWAGIDVGATGFWFPFRALHALALSLTLEAAAATEQPPPFVATETGAADRVVHQASRVAPRTFLGVESRFF